MAASSDSAYLPSLDKCLGEEKLLISWKLLSTTLPDILEREADATSIQEFLNDPEAVALLKNPLAVFPKPTAATKTAFETKTSAINVTPTSNNGRSNITEIKADALWLSKKVDIDEVSALRIVLLESQERPATRLLSNFSIEEATSLQDAVADTNTESSQLLQRTIALLTEGSESDFASEESRRNRCLQIYIHERRSFLRSAALILSTVLQDDSNGKKWVADLARTILTAVQPRKSDQFVSSCISSISQFVTQLDTGSGWFKAGDNEEIEAEYNCGKLAEVIHILEIIFQRLDTSATVPSSKLVLDWFNLMIQFGFFDRLELSYATSQALVPSLQSLAATISLQILDTTKALRFLRREDDGNSVDEDAYIANAENVSKINELLMAAANMSSRTASPALLAWAVVLQVVRQTALEQKETREIRQAQRAVEGFENSFTGSPEGTELAPRRRRSSVSSEISQDAGLCEHILEGVMATSSDNDPIKYLASVAVDVCQVFDVLIALANHSSSFFGGGIYAIVGAKVHSQILDLIEVASQFVGYLPEVLEALMAAMNGKCQYWQHVDGWSVAKEDSPIARFWGSDSLPDEYLYAAAHRFPYERLPFLRLLRCLASYEETQGEEYVLTYQVLKELQFFTHELPDDFRDYELTQEEDNANTIRLLRTIPLFQHRKGGYSLNWQSHSSALARQTAFTIPEGTLGRIITDNGPKVVLWFHPYSGLGYLGKLLQTALPTADEVDATTGERIDRDSAAEIIQILAVLLEKTRKTTIAERNPHEAWQRSQQVLEEASDGLERNQDIISVVFDLFKSELDTQVQADSFELSLDLLLACLQFIHALVPFFPARVWPLFAQSGLVNLDGNGNRLASIVGRVEMVAGRYDFLISCARIYQALIDDCVRNAAIRMTRKTRLSSQFGDWEDLGTGVPDRTLETVMSAFTQTFADVFESACNWRFVNQEDRMLLTRLISKSFGDIVHYTYGIDDTPVSTDAAKQDDSKALVKLGDALEDGSSKPRLIGALLPASQFIVDSFLSPTAAGLKFQPILRALLDGVSTFGSTIDPTLFQSCSESVTAVLGFTETVIRTGTLLEKPTSQLEGQLFRATPLIARLYASHISYRLPVVTLLDALVTGASRNSDEPPSLLGHLGSRTSKTLLDLLAYLDKPLQDSSHFLAVWNLLTTIVSNRQQWFAVYLLTGRNPRKTAKDESNKTATVQPILQIALQYLIKIKQQPLQQSVAVLRFVAASQNFWSWAMDSLQSNKEFLSAIIAFLGDLETSVGNVSSVSSGNTSKTLDSSYRLRIAAYIVDIVSMNLFHSRQLGQPFGDFESLLKNSSYLFTYAIGEPNYNGSLHSNLKRNFQARFKGCTLLNFKRSGLFSKEFGNEYFYDVQLADQMLGASEAWSGRKNDGLAKELAMANVNLSCVDAQIALLHSWKFLAMELSKHLPVHKNPSSVMESLAKKLALVASDCLQYNARSQHTEVIFARLAQSRADLALVLLQRLVETRWLITETRKILKVTWDTILQQEFSYAKAIATDSLPYYRSLLKILFLSLRAHIDGPNAQQSQQPTADNNPKINNEISQIVLAVLDQAVARDLRDIASAAHEGLAASAPEDMALITAILQMSLRMPNINFFYQQIAMIIENNDTARVATTLYSWADRLTIDGDPIYGELSMLFLLELSTVPNLAEQLAIQGVLGAIPDANISSYLQRGVVTPFGETVGQQRCYTTWVRGILPFLLNLLHAVGTPISGEVAAFLNQFPAALKSSAQSLQSPQSTRLSRISQSQSLSYSNIVEVRTLALITFILAQFRSTLVGVKDIPEVVWDASSVYESVDYWLDQRAVLRERIQPLTPKEFEWLKQKPLSASSGCHNRLEEMVVEELLGIKAILGGNDESE